jgi:Calx-beta domain/FG-GAP-like repeat
MPSFIGPVSYPVDSIPPEPAAPVQDVNGDGYYDFAMFSDRNVLALLGNGDGTFRLGGEAGPISGYITSGGGPGIGDFNGDGKFDLVATSTTYNDESNSTDYMDVWLGLGDGAFAFRITYDIGGEQTSQLMVVDLDGNGRDDVLRVGIYGNQEVWFGQADGTLRPAGYLGGGYINIYSVSHCDLNGDGRTDMIATTSNPGLSVYLGNSDGTLRYAGAYASGGVNPGRPVFADFDRDGRPDLAVLNSGSLDSETGIVNGRSLAVLLGNGDGSFQAPQVLVAGPDAGLWAVADVNADGFPDLAVTVTGSEVSVLLNAADWPAPPPPPPPSITMSDATITEGNTGTRAASFIVTLSAAYGQPVTVAYATANGTATAGSDYQASSGTLAIPAGQTTGTITAQVIGDRLPEADETFFVNLSSPTNATIADGQGMATISDDEPRISISDVTKKEGNGKKTTLFVFTVTLSAAYDQAVTMSYRTVDGTAKTSDSDYIAKTGTLTFAPGETTKTITIVVNGDNRKEANETFYLDLFGNSSNSLFTKNRGLGTILNDD